MKLTPPNWCKDAVLTTRGWVHPKTNELLIARKITTKELNEYKLSKETKVETPVVIVKELEPVLKIKKPKRSRKVQQAIEEALTNT